MAHRDARRDVGRRRVFNGLAQVLLRTTAEPGTVRLVATSDGLEPADLQIVTEE